MRLDTRIIIIFFKVRINIIDLQGARNLVMSDIKTERERRGVGSRWAEIHQVLHHGMVFSKTVSASLSSTHAHSKTTLVTLVPLIHTTQRALAQRWQGQMAKMQIEKTSCAVTITTRLTSLLAEKRRKKTIKASAREIRAHRKLSIL